ncbi:hypothetical protein [Streptomyces phytophilus]|uniref:hypothetical protein n=1 Tax=Streptomyces phytophilus TaxID=722715 RepID=UPI0015F0BB5C|nr:hypothetical protein [Streptomyces phytophilus]
MTVRGALGRLAAVVLCAAAAAACGSSSPAGELSPDAVTDKVQRIAGKNGEVYTHNAFRLPADGGKKEDLLVIVACPPSDDCTLIDRTGATYPDMQTLVDESGDVEPGDEVIANADPTDPDAEPKLKTYTRSEDGGPAWGWYAGGGALLVVLVAYLVISLRRARAAKPPDGPPADEDPPPLPGN